VAEVHVQVLDGLAAQQREHETGFREIREMSKHAPLAGPTHAQREAERAHETKGASRQHHRGRPHHGQRLGSHVEGLPTLAQVERVDQRAGGLADRNAQYPMSPGFEREDLATNEGMAHFGVGRGEICEPKRLGRSGSAAFRGTSEHRFPVARAPPLDALT
jgi:hypothetical protein